MDLFASQVGNSRGLFSPLGRGRTLLRRQAPAAAAVFEDNPVQPPGGAKAVHAAARYRSELLAFPGRQLACGCREESCRGWIGRTAKRPVHPSLRPAPKLPWPKGRAACRAGKARADS